MVSPMTRFFKVLFTLILFISGAASAASYKEYKTDNGTTIWHMENNHLPIISARIVFPIGASHEAKDKKGLVTMASATMDEGAGDMPSEVFRKKLQDYNIKFSFNATQDFFSLNMSFMSFDRAEAEKLANLALTQPRFDKEPIDLIRSQILATIRQDTTSPGGLIGRASRQSYYANHPYATSHRGNIQGLKNITQKDLKNFSKKLAQKGAFIAVVGDISKEDVLDFSKHIMADLALENKFQNNIPSLEKTVSADRFFIPLATPQTHILFQKTGLKRHDPDYIAATVASHILGGGGFGSKLMEVLREKNGLTYGVSSYMASGTYASRFHINYATDNKTAEKSIKLTQDTLNDYLAKGITQKQLDSAVRYLKGYYPIQFNTNAQLSLLAQGLWEDGLSADYPDKRNAIFDALTVEQVTAAAQKLITPPYQIFAVGGKDKPKGFEVIKKEDIVF